MFSSKDVENVMTFMLNAFQIRVKISINLNRFLEELLPKKENNITI